VLGVRSQGRRPVVSQLGLVALEPKGPIERLPNGRLVVNDQDSHALQCYVNE
jgi:hypothetical protein